MEVAGISQQFLPVLFTSNLEGIPLQHVEQVRKDSGRAMRYTGRHDGRWSQERLLRQAREYVAWGCEESREPKREVVGRVSRVVEEISRHLEFSVPDADVDRRGEQLRGEAW